jgi:DNA-binding transcriptional LysR family regulator
MNLNHLAVFHAVAQTGSMTRGADRLAISQPAASKQVRELETALGVDLFDRIGRQVQLNRAGQMLADYAQRVFALADEAEQAMTDVRSVGRGRLVVGASTTIGNYLLPRVLAAFSRQYPGIQLLVEIGNTEQMHRRLRDLELDLALTEGFVDNAELRGEVFYRDQLVVIASASHALAAQPRVSLSDLRRERFILREPGSGTRAVEEQELARLNLHACVAMALGSTEALKRVVAEGIGLALISRLSVQAEVGTATLAILPVAGLRAERAFHLVRLQERRDSPAAQAFCGVLRQLTAERSR